MNIKASDVAAIIGKNPYKTADEIFNERVKLYFDAHVDTAETLFEKALDKETVETQNVIRETLARSKSNILSAPQEIAQLPPQLKEYVQGEIYKNNGTQSESKTAQRFGVDSDAQRYTLPIFRHVRLVGLIDGRKRVDKESIVEIKNRQKRLFGKVPEYEAIQCQVYMKLTGSKRCTLIEQYRESTNEFQLEYDDALWTQEIMPSLVAFAKRLVEFQNCTDHASEDDSQ